MKAVSHPVGWLAALGVVLVAVGVVVATTGGPPQRDPRSAVGRPVQAPHLMEPSAGEEPAAGTERHRPAPHPATGAPRRLMVPQLGVDVPVVRAQVRKGTLWPPDDPQTLGWWAEGAKPGARTGRALITGHSVTTGGGAFDELETLRKGDRVRVRTGRGVIGYRVTEVTIYEKGALAKDAGQVFSQTGPGRLILVTCENYDGSSWESNVIVTTERGP